ncbi:12390_t:CDS:10, partial [Acaulospora morrowiae]
MASKEIELLENVELRFALAETDVQLEKTLNIFLSPVLLKLASPHEEVRKKVIDVLTHINKRVRPKNDIKLPLIPLIDLVCTEKVTKSAFVKNFAIMYLEMAYNRLTEEDKITHLPSLIENISSRPPTQKQTLVHIILMSLQKFKPKLADSPSSLDPYNFKARSEDGKILLGSFLDVMLYNPLASQTPFGLSHKSVKFVTNDDKASWATKSADIKFVKMGILRFVNSPVIFPDSLSDDIHLARFLIFLVATCDSSHEVVDGGEDGLKKMKKPDLESRTVVNKLYSLYQGSGSGSDQSDKIFPASTALKLKIMNYLCKSEFATNTFPSMLQVSFDCFYASPPNTKLQKQGMSFVQWAARMASISKLKPIAPVLLSGLLKFINKDEEVLYGDHEQLLSFSYISISLLAKRVPELFRTDLSILSKFFSDLYSINNNNIRSSIQEALSNMIEAYQILDEWASADDIKTIENILEESVSKSVHQSRYCAVKYAVRLFPFSHTLSRYICLLASADEKLEVCEMASRGLSFPNSQTPKLYLEKQGEVKFPHFSNMVNLIHEKSFKRADDMSHQIYVLGYRSEVYINILRFLRHLMIVSADPTVPVDELGYALESESKIFDSNSRILVKNWIKEQWELDQRESTEEMDIDGNHGTLHIYLGLLEQGLSQGKFIDKTLQSTASSSLLEIISLGPSSLARSYENRLSWLKPFMSVQKLEVRNSMAHILGIVSTSELRDDPKRCALVQELIQEFISIGKDQSKRTSVDHHGSILVLGYIIGRLIYRYPSTYDSLVPASILAEAVKLIAEDLDSSETLNINGASKALGEIGRYTSNFAILRSPDSEEGASDGDKNSDTFIAIIDKLIGLTQETIIQALGHIAM